MSKTVALVAVVDDDASVLSALKNLLSSAGYNVDVFASARSFLESGRLGDTRCLVLDLEMPEMSGHELFALLAAQHPLPIIILTGTGDDHARDRLLRDGAVAFFTKPFRAAEILAAVQRSLTS